MKRVFLWAALATSLLASSASAITHISPHVDWYDLKFRVHAAALTGREGPNYGVDVLGGFVDSLVTNRLGNQTMILDTTTSVSPFEWRQPFLGNTMAVADSNQIWAQIHFYDSGDLTAVSSSTADSLYIATQASYDGKLWFNLATFLNGTAGTLTSRLDQTNATGTFFGVLNANGASGGTPNFVWTYKVRVPLTAAKDQTGLWRYPLLRWVIGMPDAVNYSLKGRVYFNSTEAE